MYKCMYVCVYISYSTHFFVFYVNMKHHVVSLLDISFLIFEGLHFSVYALATDIMVTVTTSISPPDDVI